MLSLLRLRALPVFRFPCRVSRTSFAALLTPLRSFSSTPPALYRVVCMNCSREGHVTKWCKEPMICRSCGGEGHTGRDCPNPDPERVEALKTAPRKWYFRCGEEGHGVKECPQPAKCFHCGQSVRLRLFLFSPVSHSFNFLILLDHTLKDCPKRPNPATGRAPPPHISSLGG
ncbi:hypothetical protein C8R44DRAFT_868689 [Mycena epipterygia]|nr:hypothetical protein C8R44DRAFT_868689 [Mycena epipterygia]